MRNPPQASCATEPSIRHVVGPAERGAGPPTERRPLVVEVVRRAHRWQKVRRGHDEYRCMRRILAVSAAGLALALPLHAQSAPAQDPSGTWLTEDGRARIRVEKCGPDQNHLCGYVVW